MLAAAGCSAADSALEGATDDFIDMSPPPSNCSAGTGAEPCPATDSGSPAGGPCRDSTDCLDGNACVAPFEDGEAGDFVCVTACIDLADEASWCLDASACCDPLAVCGPRGLCVIQGGLDESGTAGSDSGSSEGSGSSGGSDSGSDTGAATSTTGMQ